MDARYLRISEDKEARRTTGEARARIADLNSSLTGQRRECVLAETRAGASDVIEYRDHDVGAAKGKARPEYQRLLAAIERGEVRRVFVLHLSRLWRNRRDRAEGIEIMRTHRVIVVAAKGPTLDMATATGRSMTALLGEIDTMESELKGERVEDWHRTRAGAGLHPGGPAPFGYAYEATGRVSAKGVAEHKLVKTADAKLVATWYRRLLAGEPLLSICRDAGVTAATMRQRLASPTYAGLRVIDGVEYQLRHPGGRKFPTTVAVDTWRAAVAMLDGRRVGTRRARTLLSGLALCERCDRTVLSGSTTHRAHDPRAYKCMAAVGGCSREWRARWLDEFIDGLVRERLSRRDLAGLLSPPAPDVDEDMLEEAAGIRTRLSGLATDSLLRGVDVTAAVTAAKTRLAEIERQTSTGADPVIASLAKAPNPARVYASFTDAGRRQAVIRTLMTITLTAPPRGRWPYHGDDQRQKVWYLSECVRIDWRT